MSHCLPEHLKGWPAQDSINRVDSSHCYFLPCSPDASFGAQNEHSCSWASRDICGCPACPSLCQPGAPVSWFSEISFYTWDLSSHLASPSFQDAFNHVPVPRVTFSGLEAGTLPLSAHHSSREGGFHVRRVTDGWCLMLSLPSLPWNLISSSRYRSTGEKEWERATALG